MEHSPSGRVTQTFHWDWYNVWIAVMALVALLACAMMFANAYGDVRLLVHLSRAVGGADAKPGDLVYAGGDVAFAPERFAAPMHRDIIENLESATGLTGIVVADVAWRHSYRSGKNTRTQTDLRRVALTNFSLVDGQKRYYPLRSLGTVVTATHKRLSAHGALGQMSRPSTWIDADVFAPKRAWFVGCYMRDTASGAAVAAMPGAETPLLLTSLSRREFLGGLLAAVIVQILAFAVFLSTGFFRLSSSVRQRFAKYADEFYFFDCTGGPEYWAIAAMILMLVAGFVTAGFFERLDLHTFQANIAFAVWFGLFAMLIEKCRRVEHVYLFSLRDHCLYLVSRGFINASIDKVAPADACEPWVREHVGSKGQKTYTLAVNLAAKTIDITDAWSTESKAQVVLDEFNAFRQQTAPTLVDSENDEDGMTLR